MALGDFVQRVREERGLTQRELARRSGVSIGTIRNLEQNVVNTLRLESARRIARVLGVSVDEMAEAAREDFEPATA
jgi:transcriptional regulator with XRE-family HTH domain